MRRLFKVVVFLLVLAVLAFLAYAYAGPIFFASDFAPPEVEQRVPVVLELE